MSEGSPRSNGSAESQQSQIWEIIHTLRTHESMIDNIMLMIGKTETEHAVLEKKIDNIAETLGLIQRCLTKAGKHHEI